MSNSVVKIRLYVKVLGFYFLALILGVMNIGAIGSLLKIIGLIPILIFFIEFRGRIRINKIIVPIGFFVLAVIMSYFWSINIDSTKERIITQMSFFLLAISVGAYNYSLQEKQYLKRMLIWSSRVSLVCTLVFAQYYQGRIYLNGVLREDPNYLCAYFLFGIVNCVERILGEKSSIRIKIISYIEVLLYIYVVFSTGSRGGAIAILFAIIMCYYNVQRSKRISLQKILAPIGIIVFAIILIFVLSYYVSPDILKRFTLYEMTQSNGTGRYRIWADAIRTYKNAGFFRQIFGFGSGTALTIARKNNFFYINVMHNAFIENLLEIGLYGLIWYTIYIFRSWNSARIVRDFFSLSVISGMIVLSLSISIGAFKPYWNIILFIICALQSDSERQTNIERG